jgi:hypothetical protein
VPQDISIYKQYNDLRRKAHTTLGLVDVLKHITVVGCTIGAVARRVQTLRDKLNGLGAHVQLGDEAFPPLKTNKSAHH